MEVRIYAAYHKDPTMLEYIETGYDLHADMAQECFLLEADQVTKQARYVSKNGFVFPSFYGDYYVGIARSMWRSITRGGLKTVDGATLQSHLRQKGIKNHADSKPISVRWRNAFGGSGFRSMTNGGGIGMRNTSSGDGSDLIRVSSVRESIGGMRWSICRFKAVAATSKVLTDKGWIPIEDTRGRAAKAVWPAGYLPRHSKELIPWKSVA